MSAETMLGLAMAMGRTLVLPPSFHIAHLGKKENYSKTYHFSDFFHMEKTGKNYYDAYDIITTEEFLLTEAMVGKLRRKQTGVILFPPENRTNWDGCTFSELDLLRQYLRDVAITPRWRTSECFVYFPSSKSRTTISQLTECMASLRHDSNTTTNMSLPIPVDSSTCDRLREFAVGRQQVCLYDEWLQQQDYLHFECCRPTDILIHFYAFLFFEDWQEDLWIKRFIRDHGVLSLFSWNTSAAPLNNFTHKMLHCFPVPLRFRDFFSSSIC
jgi:hypothetical protein